MTFKSDNTSDICPEVVAKIVAVNQESADAYGGDAVTHETIPKLGVN